MDPEPNKFQSRDMVTLVLTDFSYGYYLLWIVFYIRNIKMNIIKSLCSQTEREIGKQHRHNYVSSYESLPRSKGTERSESST